MNKISLLFAMMLSACTLEPAGLADITSPELEPRMIPREDAFIASLPPLQRLDETILVRISFQRDSIDAAIMCDYLFEKHMGTKCTYACTFGDVVGNAPTIFMEKPRGHSEWERELLRLIDQKGYSAYWLVGPQGEIDYPKSLSRYSNLFIHEVGGHGWQWVKEATINHDGFQ